MASPHDRSAILRLASDQLHRPELLTGLESWVHLALLSNEQVTEFCQQYLVCPVPVAIAEPVRPLSAAPDSSERSLVGASSPGLTTGFTSDFSNAVPAPVSSASPSPAPHATSASPNPLTRSLRSFLAEVSIIWLLVLGVFMVVVSSGVLAATQWQNFSAVGQYGILFAYTIAFTIASLWTAQQTNLRLTSRMLQLATLLIIPVNFWMMDGLQVGASLGGAFLCAIAALSLTAMLLRLLHPRTGLTSGDRFGLIASNCIGLGWLHWGWGWAGVPLIATYIGTVGTAVLLWKLSRMEGAALAVVENGSEDLPESPSLESPLPKIVIVLTALLLIGRAILAARVPVDQLGLALGLCGWVLSWLNRREQARLWRWAGAGLLLLGWLVALPADPPWQAIAVSGLILWLLIDQWQTDRSQARPLTVIALFGVGLQTYVLLWRMVPDLWRQQILNAVIQVAGDRGMPEALMGIGGFPYLLFTLGVAARLRQRARPEHRLDPSAGLTEQLALILGVGMTLTSWDNLLLRSLNLILSALTLFLVFRQRRSPLPILYLTHITALVGILSWIELLFPGLDNLANARILLVGMAIEWGLSQGSNRWQRSAWYLGLILAGWSYLLLFTGDLSPAAAYANLVGLLIPLGLTGLSQSRRFPHRRLSAWLSAAMLIAQLLLLNTLNAALISLCVAVVLMVLNTQLLRHPVAAFLTVGFALGCEAVTIALQEPSWLTNSVLANLLAANLWLLWLLRDQLQNRRQRQDSNPPSLPKLYATAANGWAIALCALTLLFLTFLCLFEPTWAIVIATGLTIGAIAYRIWQQPTNLSFYGVAWAAEILIIAWVQLNQGDVIVMAIATLSLGLLTQIVGDVWVRRSGQPYRSSWHLIPLGYGGVGWLMAHSSFVATTGLYTLAAALIGVGVGRRSPRLKSFSAMSVLLFSLAAYELLIYQLLLAEGGNRGDGVILLAGLAALIAIANRLLSRGLVNYLRLTPLELQSIAHLHWGLGSGLAVLAAFLSLSTQGAIVGLGVAGLLSGYALVMGRGNQISTSEAAAAEKGEIWTHAGIWEAIAALSYLLYRWVPEAEGWAGAIASLLAIGLYRLPWQRWGWSVHPWQKAAVGLPGLVILITGWVGTIPNLLITGAFYAWLAQSTRQIRLSYLSLLLLDWALLRYLNQQDWLTPRMLSLVLGGSLLYVAQVEPRLQTASARQQRHWMRSIATGLICLTAFYQAEADDTAVWVMRGLAVGLGLGLVLLGIMLRVRAFLYIGTAAFMLQILRLLWLFIASYSALLWAIGIILGLMLIWAAATFEARRSQMNALVQYWVSELESWE
ncbi:MAG TPA: hypothetical protein V6C84_19525 [Coleofasciculaceae cyanobacterium]